MEWLYLALGFGALWLLTQAQAGMTVSQGQTSVTLTFDEQDSETLDPVQITTGIVCFAVAIATAEGFYSSGTVPNRANNPGDLKIPNWTGPTTGTESISVFPSADEGWQRLYHQLDLIRTGASHVYDPGMSFSEMAAKWTDTQPSNWLGNVLASLNAQGFSVTADSPLSDVLNG